MTKNRCFIQWPYNKNADRGGFIRNVHVRNLTLDEVENCLYITANFLGVGAGYPSDIRVIYFSNILCQKATETAIVIQGYAKKKVSNMSLKNIEVKSVKNGLTVIHAEKVKIEDLIVGEKVNIPSALN